MSAIYVSHDLAIVAQLADRCAVMRNGAILEVGTTADILADPQVAYTRKLLAARNRAALTGARPTAKPQERQASLGGDELAAIGISVDHRLGRIALLKRRRRVVSNVSLRIGRGEVVGLIGESGSGKTSLARALCGLHPISQGSLFLDGRRLAPSLSGRTRAELQRLQIIFQSPDTALNPRSSVAATLSRALARFASPEIHDRAARIRSLLSMVGLPPEFERRNVSQLSGGQKQRLCIARALAATPSYLICDEVLSSLDTIISQEILRLITRLQTEHRFGCLFISHDLDVVRGIADRVVVLRRGQIVEEGETNRVLTRPEHPYTRGLMAAIPEIRPGWLEDAAAAIDPGMTAA
jgi:peptide/nickel transport system ATP-binding protein